MKYYITQEGREFLEEIQDPNDPGPHPAPFSGISRERLHGRTQKDIDKDPWKAPEQTTQGQGETNKKFKVRGRMLAQVARSSGSKTATKEIATGTVPKVHNKPGLGHGVGGKLAIDKNGEVWGRVGGQIGYEPGKYLKGLGGEAVRKRKISGPGSIGPVD